MFNFPILLQSVVLSLMLFCVPILAQPNQQNIESMIKRADDYRLKEESARVISLVSLYENDELDKTREYHVYMRPNRESLVIFKSAVEAGQKMLMLQDNYWLQMPKSRRPIRITPMQKLLGEASVGDISTLTWSEDYQGIWVASEKVQGLAGESVATQRLQLTAKTSGASYQIIDLWLTEQENFPLKADLYLRSGKLAKQAWFTRGERNGEVGVTEMTLLDHIQPAKKTVIEYQDVQPWQLEDKFYNPSYLSKADSVQF
ncbi:TPA: outer membrane lipoprotein-sorting protein [Vibrio vulnificus]|nr:outer membrane lipoprotein-sorting protein [Vibrio vulnificus]